MEVALFAAAGLAFIALFLWLMTSAAKSGRLILAAVLGALAISTPLSMLVPMFLAGGTASLAALLLLASIVLATAWLARRSYRSGVSAQG